MFTKRLTLILVVMCLLLTTAAVTYAQGGNGDAPICDNCPNAGQPNQAGQGMQNRYGQADQMPGRANQQQNRYGNQAVPCANCLASTLEPTEAVIAAMTDGINDEYNAYLTYLAIIEQFGEVLPFANILTAEAQHIAAWEAAFDRYDLPLPIMPAEVELPTFTTLADACTFALTAEENNMSLYDSMLEALADYPDLVQVVTHLRDASAESHLPAFEFCAGQ